MKQKLQSFFFLILLGTIGAKAQGPVITAVGLNPQVGDSYKIQTTKIISLSQDLVGGNKIWDFSNLVDSGEAFIESFISAKGQPGIDNFPTANLAAVYSISSSTVVFLQTSDTAYGQVGQSIFDALNKNVSSFWRYTPKSTSIVYPMSLGTQHIDSYVRYLSADPNDSTQFNDTIKGIGYGTLKLPSVSYNNVLCVYIDGNYDFLVNGIHEVLLELIYNGSGWQAEYNLGVPLPLQISSFTASWQNKTPYLQWDAANTENTKAFNIQRSLDGRTFNTVKQVAVSGSSSYHFEDNYSPTSTVFYRLQQVDKDGQPFYSNTAQLTINDKQFSISPNPAKDFATISFNKIVDKATIAGYDITGKAVITQSLSGTNAYKLNTQTLTNGIYVIKVNTDTGNYNEKLLINK